MWFIAYVPIKSLQKTIKTFFITTVPFLILFAFIQYYYPNHIPMNILNLYGGESHVINTLTHSEPRIIATGSDPNIGAVIILLYLLFFIATFVNKKSLLSAIYLLLLLIALSLTASRTTIVAGMFVFFIYVLFSKRIKLICKIILIFLIFLFNAYVWYNIPYVRLGFILLFEGQNNSILLRLDKFQESLLLFKQSPLFGWGPAKAVHTTVVDGEYFLLLRRYGLIGLSCFLFFLLKSIWFSFKTLKILNLKKDEAIITITFLSFSVSQLVIMLTNNFLSGYQTIYPFFVLLVFVYKINISYKSRKKHGGVNSEEYNASYVGASEIRHKNIFKRM